MNWRARRPQRAVRHVLLDDTFIHALLDADAAAHADAGALYGELIDRYENERDRLFALSSVLADLPAELRRGALAPVLTLHVAAQHRRAAAMIGGPLSPFVALSLVMMQRERIRTVASATYEFDQFDVEVLSVAPRFGDDVESISSPTAHLSAPRSTDG